MIKQPETEKKTNASIEKLRYPSIIELEEKSPMSHN